MGHKFEEADEPTGLELRNASNGWRSDNILSVAWIIDASQLWDGSAATSGWKSTTDNAWQKVGQAFVPATSADPTSLSDELAHAEWSKHRIMSVNWNTLPEKGWLITYHLPRA